VTRDPFIEPDALLALGAFHFFDVREIAPFAAEHPAGATRVPIEAWEAAARSDETGLENVGFWERTITDLGIDGQIPSVVYDDGRMTEAARVWFILQYFGLDAYILDGGWPAIQGRIGLLETPVSLATPTLFRAQPGAGSAGLIDRQRLKAEVETDTRIFDARTIGEFSGEDLRRNARGGHLPGACPVPHDRLTDAGRMKPAHVLRDLLTRAGLESDSPIVTHCNGGGRAALAAAAALRAGYDNVRVYYLGFADWAKDEGCTVVRD